MQTLRLRTRVFFSALFAIIMMAAVFAPMVPAPRVSAEESRVMATEQVYVRSGPSTADTIIGELQGDDWVTTTGNNENGYTEVWYGDWVGYVFTDYLSIDGTATETAPAAETSDDAAPATETSDVTWGSDGWLYTVDSVNLRSGPSTGDGVVTILPAGASVYITGASSNGFNQIESDYGSGWVHSDYLGSTAPTTTEAVAAQPVVTSQAQQLVDFAMQYHGYPYVWAGNTPSGFDCSGFTQYVVQNVLGYDITHSTDLQAGFGTPVAWGEWQPGDLIFFVGTGGGGYISHVGIYIGDGQMIHAENPGTGVVISSVYSSYYSEHYYSSTRLD